MATKKTAVKKAASGKKTLKVKLIKSTIACQPKQRATALGLGLTKVNKVMVLEDTPCVRGMINKIIHMVEVEL
jgi:large subunit ribosomal protein L30